VNELAVLQEHADFAHFERHGIPPDWLGVLSEFQSHCPMEEANTYVDFVGEGDGGIGVG
jgi:hypothetical protein